MKIIKSFRYAIQGIYYIWASELHFRLHFILALAVGCAGYITGLSRIEWIVIILCISAVMTAEALNSAIEKMGDAVTLEKNDHIRIAKDMAAGAVLLVSLGSLLCGFIIFLPKWI